MKVLICGSRVINDTRFALSATSAIIAASAYLIALLIIHLLAPKLEPAKISYE